MTPNLRMIQNPEWRKRCILLPEAVVQSLFEWVRPENESDVHSVRTLAAEGMRNLVSLSMIDAAVDDLVAQEHSDRGRGIRYGSINSELAKLITDLKNIRRSWRNYDADASGLGDVEFEYDLADHGRIGLADESMRDREESEIDTSSE
jgi:hypothetical protein